MARCTKRHKYNLGRCFFDAYLVESNCHTSRGQITTHAEAEIKLQHLPQQPLMSRIRWSLFKGLPNFLRRTLLVTAPRYCNTLLQNTTATQYFSAPYLLGVARRDSSDKSPLTGYESWHIICAMTVTDWFVPWLIDMCRDSFMCAMTCWYVPWLDDDSSQNLLVTHSLSRAGYVLWNVFFVNIYIYKGVYIYIHTHTNIYMYVYKYVYTYLT